MQALKRRFKRSAEDEADDPDADIQRGMWKNHKLLPPALPAGKSPSSKQSSKAAAAEAAGRAYTHKQALAHGVKDGCIDSSMSSGAAASMVM